MIWYKDIYGDDIDGNRGVEVWEADFEQSDDEWVIPQLMDYVEENGYLPKMIDVNTINPFTEDDVSFEIDTSDYKYLEARFEVWEGEQLIERGLLLEEAEEEYDESFDIRYNRNLED